MGSNWDIETLDVADKLERSEPDGFAYWGIALVAAFTRNYILCWKILISRPLLISDAAIIAVGEQLRNLLKAALELSTDNKTPVHVNGHTGEVSDIIGDANRYVHMMNRIILCRVNCKNSSRHVLALLEGLQQKVEQDFAFLTNCSFDDHFERERYEALSIEQKYVKILGFLGRGSYSVVYKAKWCAKEVAVKEILDSGDCDWSANWIMKELKVQAKLQAKDSSHVLQLLGYFENRANGNKSLVLELMSTDLQRFIKESPSPVPMLQKIDIMIKISKGMKHLHSSGVIHRDLKPSNIMVSPTPNNLLVKIADFGISKDNFRNADTNTLNRGSLNYMAPEMMSVHASGYYTKSVDVYSFAMTCWEILTGQLPFLKPILDIQAFKKRLEGGERPVLPTNVPKRLKHLIQLCWSGDPDSRPTFEWISKELWALKEYLLTYSALQDKLEYLLQIYWGKDAHSLPTFEHICEELFGDMEDLLTKPNLSKKILYHLMQLHEDGDSASLRALEWACDQLWAAGKTLLTNHKDALGQLGSLLWLYRDGGASSRPSFGEILNQLDLMEI